MSLKDAIRSVLIFLHLDITKNLEYDRLTHLIMKKVLKPDSNCIDIGCHKGEILDTILSLSPKGKHFGFEPLPHLYNNLKTKYSNIATIYPYALSDKNGESTFQFVKNAPAYSGLKKRRYDIENPEIEEIKVEVKTLDEIIPQNTRIDFIKIDVEGGEFGVLKGAANVLKSWSPAIIFECGEGSSNYYETKATDLYTYLCKEYGYRIYTLKSFVSKGSALSEKDFEENFVTGKEYYFVATR